MVAQVTRLMGHRYLLGQASAEGVGTGNDDAVINTQFEECITASVDLGQEIGMGNRYLAVLVATLLLVRYLVLLSALAFLNLRLARKNLCSKNILSYLGTGNRF